MNILDQMERRSIYRSPGKQKRPALFLDRDGVLIDDVHYLRDPKNVVIMAGADELLTMASSKGWSVVVITNQSGISRGFFDWDAYDAVTERMLDELHGRAAIEAIYANGYGPEQAGQPWRKPNPGMIIQAAAELNIDLARSILIGDRLSDLKAGLNAKLSTLIHVRTGHGENEYQDVLNGMQSALMTGNNHPTSLHMIDDLTQFPGTLLYPIASQP